MPIKFKTIEATVGEDKVSVIPLNDKGLPVVIDEKGEEIGLDAIHLYTQVPALRTEAKTHREAKEKAEKLLKKLTDGFENLDLGSDESVKEWLAKITGAIETVDNLDQKKLVQAGEVEAIKKAAREKLEKEKQEQKAEYEKVIESQKAEIESLNGTIFQHMVADKFYTSKFVKDDLQMTSEMARRYFSSNFKVEAGDNGQRQVVGYYDGEKIYSRERVGELADFDEALEFMVDNDPDKVNLRVGDAGSGGGAGGGEGGRGGGGGKGQVNPWKSDTFNMTEQARLLREQPDLAKRYQREAGVQVIET